MILLCQRSPHIINIQVHVLKGTEQMQFALLRGLFLRFCLRLARLGLLAVNFTTFCLRLASPHFACG